MSWVRVYDGGRRLVLPGPVSLLEKGLLIPYRIVVQEENEVHLPSEPSRHGRRTAPAGQLAKREELFGLEEKECGMEDLLRTVHGLEGLCVVF